LSRVGHGGTLDPAAGGVLPIAVGKATRLLQFLPQDKAYRATIQFGITTTTDDLEGEIITSQPAADLSLEQIVPILKQFQGKIVQIPPKYSAIQVQGKRLYELARAGAEIDVPARTVEVDKIDILDWQTGDFPKLEVAIACGAGTYIRAIARDLGAVLGTGGTLAALTRTRSSGFEIATSISLEELAEAIAQGSFDPISPHMALQHLPRVNLPNSIARKWCLGQKISYPEIPVGMINDAFLRVEAEGDRFLGIGRFVETDDVRLLVPQIVFVQP
jgi:tRNA pseudouridine55 synthase